MDRDSIISGFNRDYGATSSTSTTGFSPTEFISLSDSILNNILFVKQSWQFLEKANKAIGTAKDNQTIRDKVHAIQTNTNQKITTTSKDLQRLSVVVRGGDRQQRLQVDKLTSDFKYVVEIYSKNQQVIAAKMKQVLLVNAPQQDDINKDEENDEIGLIKQQKLKQQQQNLQLEQEVMLEREQRVRQIEADVLDINEIMKELSSLTHQQASIVDSIEEQVENVAGDIEDGRTELEKAAEYQNKYRRKVLILLAIAVIIGIIITSIVVSKLKS